MFRGIVGERYKRIDVQEMLQVPEARRGGNWTTGYTEWEDQFFVFCNIDVPGRTGHDYANYWDGQNLVWEAKNGTTAAQPQMARLLKHKLPVHIFHRQQDRTPFIYAGIAYPISYEETSPVKVKWGFVQAVETELDINLLEEELTNFEAIILKHSGKRFQSIVTGLAGEWENYKLPLREQAVTLLKVDTWKREDIGSGGILNAVISAIEISGREGNNLVRWQGQYGQTARIHTPILNALKSDAETRRAENLFFSFYKNEQSDANCFGQMVSEFGKSYALLAYLFFIKNPDAYMPIATRTFDKAFARLGIDLRTSYNCSWDNYFFYNSALQSIRSWLMLKPGFEDCRLVDAHSFLWILIRKDEEAKNARRGSGNRTDEADQDARKQSILDMVRNAYGAAAQSGKARVRIYKNKEVREEYLPEVIEDLINEQNGFCNISGLKLQFLGEHDDPHMLASLDRIDSNGHYEKENLQVVCRFVNQWKSDGLDADFRRLLGIIRSGQTL